MTDFAASFPPSPAHAQSFLTALGSRPDPSLVSQAELALSRIDTQLSQQLFTLLNSSPPHGVDPSQWSASKAQEETKVRALAEKEKLPYKSVIQLNKLHQIYEDLVNNQDTATVKMLQILDSFVQRDHVAEEYRQDVAKLVLEAVQKRSDKLDLSDCLLVSLPVSFGKLSTLVSLDLSCNQLKELPASVAKLMNLEIIDLHSNQLSLLPESVGSLHQLKILNVSGNMLKALPESIGGCSYMVELMADFNQLERLPARIGHELRYLQKLSAHSNKLSFLPASICELGSLRVLDLHFNNLMSLPTAIGNLIALEKLNLSNNFSDFGGKLPESLGDLLSLTELDLSFNQIRVLPDSLGALKNLKLLKVDNNPLIIPPLEIVEHSLEAVKEYMAERLRTGDDWDKELVCMSPRRARHFPTTIRLCTGTGLPWFVSTLIGKCSGRMSSLYATGPPPQRMLSWEAREVNQPLD